MRLLGEWYICFSFCGNQLNLLLDCVRNSDVLLVVCSFFLQLSLLDLSCAAYFPSVLAAAALSNAFELFNQESWPQMLQQYSAYKTKEVQSCKDKLKEVQATTSADQLRKMWCSQYNNHGCGEVNEAWAKAQLTLARPTQI